MIRTVLLDLDGTLADTAPDLAHALNRVLAEEGRPALSDETIRPHVSHGVRALLQLGFGELAEAERERLRQRFLALYRDDLARHTRLFPGMAELLVELGRRGLNWGIVTNKAGFLTGPLLARLPLPLAPASVVSGDTTAHCKPHPEPLLLACTRAGSRPAECLYVGDAERDVEAGRRAGMKTLVALFGYISKDDRPERWGADGLIHSPRQVLDWLDATQG